MPKTVAVSVMLEHTPGTNDEKMVTVAASSGGITIATETVDVTSGSGTGMLTITPAPDADADHETVEVTASYTIVAVGDIAERTISDTANLTIVDTQGGPVVPPAVGSVVVTTNVERVREDARTRSVEVTATLPSAPGTGITVVVTVTGTVEGTETTPSSVSSVDIMISGDETSGTGTITVTPSNDDEFTTRSIMVTASATGYSPGTADPIEIADDDTSLGTFSVTSAPPSVTLGSSAQALTLTVKVVLASPDTEIPSSLVVNVKADKGTLVANTVTITGIKKNVDKDPTTTNAEGTGTVVLDLTADDANAAGTITVTAAAGNYVTGTRTIPITDRDAADIAGYRLVLVKPAAGGWAKKANDQVIVDVIRVGSVAYPWTDFESIKVSVRDTSHVEHEIDAVTGSDFNREDDGAITFSESGSRGDVIWRGNDTMRFEIKINGYNTNQDPSSNGQYLGVYVVADFTVGSTTSTITNRQSDDPVYPSNPTLVSEANRYVGDGKLVKVDNLSPSSAAISAVNVTNADGEPITAVKVGDEVRVAVAVSGDVLFRDSGIRVQIQPQDGMGSFRGRSYSAGQVAPITETVNFSAAQVISAASDSLRTSWKITEGFFEYKTDDFVDFIGPKGTPFEADNTIGRVLVAVKDQAANYSGADVTTFDADSRLPKVSILYPSADPDSLYDHTHSLRFTGAAIGTVEGQNVDAHLNPLRISADEDLESLKVFAVGADSLTIENYRDGLFAGSNPGEVDSLTVDTSLLNSTKKDGEGDDDKYPDSDYVPSSANVAGTEITLAVLATDRLGNTTETSISGVTHDAKGPEITEWFPRNSLLPDGQINEATRHPVFNLPEAVDTIAVTFAASSGTNIVEEIAGVTDAGETQVMFSDALVDEETYTMTIFARDLAGNVFLTPQDASENMRFNAEFDNPRANDFSITNQNGLTETNETALDSVIAGQALVLRIQAIDHDASSNTSRDALTYKNTDEDGMVAAEVRISAWDANGGAAESVWFEGKGVGDNGDGSATLDAAGWLLGKRDVTVKSNKAVGLFKVLVEHRNAGAGGTTVAAFDSDIDSLYVGAADFAGFDITAWEEDVEGAAQEVWGDFTLQVVPVDRHGNPSVRAFKADFDSLDVLDTRVADNAYEYKDGIDVTFGSVPVLEELSLLVWPIGLEGATFEITAPENRRTLTIQVRTENEALEAEDARSQNTRSTVQFKISAPLTPVLTLWVPGSDVDEAGNDVVIPADPGDITVTVAAAGFNAGDMVTFTKNGTALDPVAANDDGAATLDITMAAAGTVTVSATNGVYSADELAVVFVDAPTEPAVPTRKAYANAAGEPVYLVYSGDAPPDMTVGLDDFNAFALAFGSSEGDIEYNLQADVDDDGDVDLDDYAAFIASYGRTDAGPATKPLVLLPGINENAEFSLSLGSERVVLASWWLSMCRLPMSRLWSDMGSRSITRTISSSSSVWLLPMRICSSQQVEKPRCSITLLPTVRLKSPIA